MRLNPVIKYVAMSRFITFLTTILIMAAAVVQAAPELQETPSLAGAVANEELPPVAERAPAEPLFVDPEATGRRYGTPGGTLSTFVSRDKDIRMMVVYGYARLVGYNEKYELAPDILASVDNEENKVFTLHLRAGHRWSDGAPFTSEDFRYWWEDVANNEMLSPSAYVIAH